MERIRNRNMLFRLVIIGFSICAAGTPGFAEERPAVPGERAVADDRPGPLGIAVSGSAAGVSSDYFQQAVTEAVEASDIFSAIADSEAANINVRILRVEGSYPDIEAARRAPYFLHVRIIKVETPSFSVRMTVDIDVLWELYRTADKSELMRERIESSYTGGFLEGGLHGGNRVRVAMEGAMRENVRTGVEKLATVDFDKLAPLDLVVGQEGSSGAGPDP